MRTRGAVMVLREYRNSDGVQIWSLFFDTVHSVNSKDYTVEQCHAWAPHDIDVDKWCQPFRTGYTVVAQEKGTIVGFAHSTADGHYDYLFVHKDFQGLGIAKRLTERIEDYARKMDCVEITAHVSITARPFFERQGYGVERENTVERSGIQLLNYTMKKQ